MKPITLDTLELLQRHCQETRCSLTVNYVCAAITKDWDTSLMEKGKYKTIPDKDWYDPRWVTHSHYRLPTDDDCTVMRLLLNKYKFIIIDLHFGNLSHQMVLFYIDDEIYTVDSYVLERGMTIRKYNPLDEIQKLSEYCSLGMKKELVELWNKMFVCREEYYVHMKECDPPLSYGYSVFLEEHTPGFYNKDYKDVIYRTLIDENGDLYQNDKYLSKSCRYTEKIIEFMRKHHPIGCQISF